MHFKSLAWYLLVAVIVLAIWIVSATIVMHSMVSVARGDDAKPAGKLQGGATQWGDLEVAGPRVVISGGTIWSGVGTVLANGDIHLHWLQLANERPAFGVYRVNESGNLVGKWGWGENISLERDGTFGGLEFVETVVVSAPKGPDL